MFDQTEKISGTKRRSLIWSYRWFFFGLVLTIGGILFTMVFKNPNPCTTSGIGCSSPWEMLTDSCAVTVGVILTLVGMVVTICSAEAPK
jgi:hypothetical protein